MSDAGARLHPCCSRTSSRPPKRSPPPHRASPRSRPCHSCWRAPTATRSPSSSESSSPLRAKDGSGSAGAESPLSMSHTQRPRPCRSATSTRGSHVSHARRVPAPLRPAPPRSCRSRREPPSASGTCSPERCWASCAPARSAACFSTRSPAHPGGKRPRSGVRPCSRATSARRRCSRSPARRPSSMPWAWSSDGPCCRCSPRPPRLRPRPSRSRAGRPSNTSSTARASRCTAAATR